MASLDHTVILKDTIVYHKTIHPYLKFYICIGFVLIRN